MNIYDTRTLHCRKCGKCIDKVDYSADMTIPKCGKCVNLTPEIADKITYAISKYQNFSTALVIKK